MRPPTHKNNNFGYLEFAFLSLFNINHIDKLSTLIYFPWTMIKKNSHYKISRRLFDKCLLEEGADGVPRAVGPVEGLLGERLAHDEALAGAAGGRPLAVVRDAHGVRQLVGGHLDGLEGVGLDHGARRPRMAQAAHEGHAQRVLRRLEQFLPEEQSESGSLQCRREPMPRSVRPDLSPRHAPQPPLALSGDLPKELQISDLCDVKFPRRMRSYSPCQHHGVVPVPGIAAPGLPLARPLAEVQQVTG